MTYHQQTKRATRDGERRKQLWSDPIYRAMFNAELNQARANLRAKMLNANTR